MVTYQTAKKLLATLALTGTATIVANLITLEPKNVSLTSTENKVENTISFGELKANASWQKRAWDIFYGYVAEKALDTCVTGPCQEAIQVYGKWAMKSRVIRNEAMYIQNNQLSPMRKKYHQKQCVSDNTWMRMIMDM
jgi:hypothetical protein